MKHSGRTIININGKDYVVKFGMGALMQFSEGFEYDVQETIEQLTKPGINQIKAISKFIYTAIYVDAIYSDAVLEIELKDVVDWVDQTNSKTLSVVIDTIMSGIAQITDIDYPSIGGDIVKKK